MSILRPAEQVEVVDADVAAGALQLGQPAEGDERAQGGDDRVHPELRDRDRVDDRDEHRRGHGREDGRRHPVARLGHHGQRGRGERHG